jgi:hypothetical protein
MKSILVTIAGAAALAATTIQSEAQGGAAGAGPAASPAPQQEFKAARSEFRRVHEAQQDAQARLQQVQGDLQRAEAVLQFSQAVQAAPAAGIGTYGSGGGGSVGFVGNAFGGTVSSSRSRDSVPPVVIQFSEISPTNIATIEEDLTVTTRLIDKAIENSIGVESPLYKSGIPMVVTSSSRSVRPLYVDGFGALFMVKVNFPVLGTVKRDERKEPKAEPAKTEWNEAREELFPTKQTRWAAEEEQFNPAQVDALKNGLLAVLQQAANIRHLKPEEFLSINVFGQPATFTTISEVPSDSRVSASRAGNTPNATAAPRYSTRAVAYVSQKTGNGTVMTIRAKKSDIDALAKGTIDLEAFKSKATVNAYNGNGYDVKSVNSWVKPSTSSTLR